MLLSRIALSNALLPCGRSPGVGNVTQCQCGTPLQSSMQATQCAIDLLADLDWQLLGYCCKVLGENGELTDLSL